MITTSEINQLEEKLFNCILNNHEKPDSFHDIARSILYSSQRDYIFGGMFDDCTNASKSLAHNAYLANVFILAANYFGDSNYARLALETLAYLNTYHHQESGLFTERSQFAETKVNAHELQSILTPSQWLALKTCFALPESGNIPWHQLETEVPMEQVSQHSGLHPKEVPLVLDGALQILRSLIREPEQMDDESILSNLLFCKSLYLSATYLNQAEHGVIADSLYERLSKQDLTGHLSALLSLLLIKLRYQWDTTVYDHLIVLYRQFQHQEETDVNLDDYVCAELLIQSQTQTSNNAISYQPECLTGMVIIHGPEFLARQWLQETNNRIQLSYRFFAIPETSVAGSTKTRAQLIRTDGTIKEYESLDDLLSLAV